MTFDLVFEGGGAKGIVFVGAMQAFEAAGHTHGRLLGTSAGAITAALVAAGYTSAEMLQALNERENGRPVFVGFTGVPGPFSEDVVQASAIADLLQRVDVPFVPEWIEKRLDEAILRGLLKIKPFRHLFSFVEKGGWFSASRFETWMRDKLNTGTFDGAPRRFGDQTLRQFFEATGADLSLIASDTTARQLLVLNHRTAPDCPVVWAVRMSMSIPLLWQEVTWQAGWGAYRGQPLTDHALVDGGALSNFPIELLVSRQSFITTIMGEKQHARILGLLIDEALPVEGAPPDAPQGGGIEWGKLRAVQRLEGLIDTMMSAHDKQVMDAFEDLVVRLPAQGYGTTEFDMSDARRDALVAAGRAAMQRYLAALPKQPRVPEPGKMERADHIADRIAGRILEGRSPGS